MMEMMYVILHYKVKVHHGYIELVTNESTVWVGTADSLCWEYEIMCCVALAVNTLDMHMLIHEQCIHNSLSPSLPPYTHTI